MAATNIDFESGIRVSAISQAYTKASCWGVLGLNTKIKDLLQYKQTPLTNKWPVSSLKSTFNGVDISYQYKYNFFYKYTWLISAKLYS